jgi:hypothetical protein
MNKIRGFGGRIGRQSGHHGRRRHANSGELAEQGWHDYEQKQGDEKLPYLDSKPRLDS